MQLTSKDLFKLGIFPFLVYTFNSICQSLADDFYINYSVDTLSHFLGGLSIAYSANYALSLMEKRGWIVIHKNILRAGIIMGAVMTFAVLWEFYEFIYDLLLWGTTMQPSIADTIKDFTMAMIGVVVFSVGMLYKMKKK